MEHLKESSKEEIISSEKGELLGLEKQGNFVFHGTAADIDILEPRQAVDTIKGPDRDPAIFASSSAEFAIFHAIINGKNVHDAISESGADQNKKDGSYKLKFGLPKGILDQLPDSACGWVYVFNKKDFKEIPDRYVEFESNIAVTPIKKIQVFKRDLPSDIEEIKG